jgi:hypothetical protein
MAYGAWRSPVAHLLWERARDPWNFTEIVESQGFSRSARVGEAVRYREFVDANVHTYVHTHSALIEQDISEQLERLFGHGETAEATECRSSF